MKEKIKQGKKKCKKFFNKYVIRKGTLILSIFLVVISLIALGYSTYNVSMMDAEDLFNNAIAEMNNKEENGENNKKVEDYKKSYSKYKFMKEFSTVLFSVFGVNLFLSLAVEKRAKNESFKEFFTEDIISEPKFYGMLDDSNAKKMLAGLEQCLYYEGNEKAQEICRKSREAILESVEDYYFSDCSYTVTVVDKGNYFEKEIVHSVKIKPYYDEHITINNFCLAKCKFKKVDGLDNFVLNAVSYNGTDITKFCVSDISPIKEKTGKMKDFDSLLSVNYNQKITIGNNHKAEFIVSMTTRCPKDDITSTFRASNPCEKFSVDYTIKNDNYKLVTDSFGICKLADDTASSNVLNEAHVKFTEWLFRDDGVVITMVKQ